MLSTMAAGPAPPSPQSPGAAAPAGSRLRPPAAARAGSRRRGERGSGTAVGVAMIFPMLMLVIVVIRMLSDSTRAEQVLQATANQAARVAALCCYQIDGDNGAVEVVRAGLDNVTDTAAGNRIFCVNDMAGDADIVFTDVSGNTANTGPVPSGGMVFVFLTCRIPPQALGGFGLPGLDAERSMVGVATIDPFRSRPGA